MEFAHTVEQVGGGVEIVVTPQHTFFTDSFLLSYFAAPKKHENACDLGSGSGVIPLLWFRDRALAPRMAWGVDIQPQAVEQMHLSAQRSGLAECFVPLEADLCTLKKLPGAETVDLITCNPPYKAVGTGLMSADDSARITRHEITCTLDDVCACAERLLRFGGRLCLCQLPERLVDVLDSMRRHRIEPKRIRFVQQRANSAPWLFLVEGKRGARPFLTADPPLILRDGDDVSPEMQRIYADYGKV